MKTRTSDPHLMTSFRRLPGIALVLCAVAVLIGLCARSQTLTTIHAFPRLRESYVAPGGEAPQAPLFLSGGTIYGTVAHGGANGYGFVFKATTTGDEFTILHDFTYDDGSVPNGGLLLVDDALYGTTEEGGCGSGVIFRLNSDGSGFTNLYQFSCSASNTDGINPNGGLTLIDQTLYGTAHDGGAFERGTVFKIVKDGSDFRVIYDFPNERPDDGGPKGGLVSSGDTLFGARGDNYGTIFRLNSDGTGYTNILVFPAQVFPHHTEYSMGRSPNGYLWLSTNTVFGTARFGGPGGGDGHGTIFGVNTDGSGAGAFHTFDGVGGSDPQCGLVQLGKTFYGTTSSGGSGENGVVFKFNAKTSEFTVLHDFSSRVAFTNSEGFVTQTNSDGAEPMGGVVIAGELLLGAATGGGSAGGGSLFAVDAEGTSFANIRNFDAALGVRFLNDEGGGPSADLVLGGALFGMAGVGGLGGGTVFSLNTNGADFSVLHFFTPADPISRANSDGASPTSLVEVENVIYGTTFEGGVSGKGVIFKMNTNGAGYSILHTFEGPADGAFPIEILPAAGNVIYGAASAGGPVGGGTIFRLDMNGGSFSILHSFPTGSPPSGPAAIILSGDILFGTTQRGGEYGKGAVFKLGTDGMGFTNLHSFDGTNGSGPLRTLLVLGQTLYGSTVQGGTSDAGIFYKMNTDGTGFEVLRPFTLKEGNGDGSSMGYSGGVLYGATASSLFSFDTEKSEFTTIYEACVFGNIAYFSSFPLVLGAELYGTTSGGGSMPGGNIFRFELQPGLSITRDPAGAVVSWPSNFTGFTLQSATNLAPTPIWSDVPAIPLVVNERYRVTTPASEPGKFYRLQK